MAVRRRLRKRRSKNQPNRISAQPAQKAGQGSEANFVPSNALEKIETQGPKKLNQGQARAQQDQPKAEIQAQPEEPSKETKDIVCRGFFRGSLQGGPADPKRSKGLADEHLDRGNIYAQRGAWDEAFVHYEKALTVAPEYAEGHNNLGICKLVKGKIQEAIDSFSSASRNYPSWSVPAANAGLAYEKAGDVDNAVQWYEKSLSVNNKQPQIWVMLGLQFEKRKELDLAVKAYSSAVAFSPKYDRGNLLLGLVLAKKGSLNEAEMYLKVSYEVNAQLCEAPTALGMVEMQRKNPGKAKRWFELAQQARPSEPPKAAVQGIRSITEYFSNLDETFSSLMRQDADILSPAECFYHLGRTYIEENRLNEAETAFRNAHESAPQWFEPLPWIAVISLKNNRCRDGIAVLEKAHELQPDDLQIQKLLGTLYVATGDRKKGQALFNKDLSDSTTSASIAEESGNGNGNGNHALINPETVIERSDALETDTGISDSN